MSKSIRLTQQDNPTGSNKRIRLGQQGAASSGNSKITLPYGASYVLNANAFTSAGVYDSNGKLLRTLWSGVQQAAGTHTISWDNNDDAGNDVGAVDYHFVVLANNVSYTWEGIIGNTSANLQGSGRHVWFDRMWDMCISGTKAYYCTGYTEQHPSQHSFDLSNPQVVIDFYTGNNTYQSKLISRNVCTDGSKVYWASFDANQANFTCVFATNVSNNAEVSFADGVAFTPKFGRAYNVIDLVDDSTQLQYITGIAVQPTGNYLFVARRLANSVHVVNKTTGALVQSLTVTTPGYMCIDGNNKLWMVSNGTVSRYTINGNGTLSSAELTLAGITTPISVNVSNDGNTVVIGDAATHQYKAFSATNGAAQWTYGVAGGYVNSPDIADNKFSFLSGKSFSKTTDYDLVAHVAYQADGSIWFGDSASQRIMRMNAPRTTKLDEILCLGFHYSAFIDPNNPARLFANYLEYEIDYTKPLQVGNGSWKLKRNWIGNADPLKDSNLDRLKYVATLPNGRTYAWVKVLGQNRYETVELTATGLRYTGVVTTDLKCSLEPNGDIHTITGTGLNQSPVWKKQTLTGFDVNGNPQYSALTTVASASPNTVKSPVSNGGNMYRNQTSSSNIITCLCEDVPADNTGRGSGYHLGGIRTGGTDWLWKASPANLKEYRGNFPTDGTFDIGNSVTNAVSFVSTIGRNVLYGYHGEFWKQMQTNKWLHFYDNGLYVSQFGVVGPEARAALGMPFPDAYPGYAGNALNFTIVQAGGNIYLYHCDENVMNGVHRWKITGLDTIQEIIIT